jgi:hypothetical protein
MPRWGYPIYLLTQVVVVTWYTKHFVHMNKSRSFSCHVDWSLALYSGNPPQPVCRFSKVNYTLWMAQVLAYPVRRVSCRVPRQLHRRDEKDFNDIEVAPIPNLNYPYWVALEEQVLSYMLASLSHVVPTHTQAELFERCQMPSHSIKS